MNRETSFHSSDTLVVVDGSRRRRQLMIAGVVAAVLLIVAPACMSSLVAARTTRPEASCGQGAGQVPSVTVIVPGPKPGRPRRSPPAGRSRRAVISRSASPAPAAGWSRVLVDAGSWVRAGQVLAVVDRSVQAQQAAQLAAQVEAARANAALAQNELRARESRSRAAASCPRRRSIARRRPAMPPTPRCASPRRNLARRAHRSAS